MLDESPTSSASSKPNGITRSPSVIGAFEWLKRAVSSEAQFNRDGEKRQQGDLPSTIEAGYTEHTMDTAAIADRFPLSRIHHPKPENSSGLMHDEATARLDKEGPNTIVPTNGKSKSHEYISQYLQSFRLLLLITGFTCIVIFLTEMSIHQGELYMAVVIFAVLIFMSSLGYIQAKWTRKYYRGFQSMIAPSCKVMRHGKPMTITAESLVVGDIVCLSPGNRVPADIRLLHTERLRLETSWITGELNAQEFVATTAPKDLPPMQALNIAFHGCSVVSGSAVGVVIRTGNQTALGKLVCIAAEDRGKQSTLIRDKVHFVRFICILSVIIGAVVFLIGIATSRLQNVAFVLINGFFVVLVANIPQGLPVILTAQLLVASKRLAKKSIYLKRLDTAETLGTVSALLVDKTGTLTENAITVTELWFDGEVRPRNPHHNHRNCKERLPVEAFPAPMDAILEVIIMCNTAQCTPITQRATEWRKASIVSQIIFSKHRNVGFEPDAISLPDVAGASAEYSSISGSPMECALLRFADEFCLIHDKREELEVVFEIPFNKQRRWHLVIAKSTRDANEDPETIIRYRLLLKGAPEELITRCFNFATRHGLRRIGEEELITFKDQYLSFGNRGRSCIGFASVEFEDKAGKVFDVNSGDYPQDGLTFLGMAALLDAPQPDVRSAVRKAKDAGIKVHVVTGDHASTAAAIATEAGLLDEKSPKAMVVIGEMVESLTPHEWDHLLKRDNIVFARITPDQKRQVVEELEARGEVVGVTGDGVLDAHALKEAHVGIAVEAAGSAIAKEAADVVVAHANLSNILFGIEHGRLVFENLKKAMTYTLTHLLAELLPVLLTFVLGLPMGLTSIQILCIDLLCEIVPAISMVCEPPERDLMQKPPRKESSRLVSRSMLVYAYLTAGSILATGCFLAYLSVYWSYGIRPADMLYTATTYWRESSPHFHASSGSVYSGADQASIRRQACGAWHITLMGGQAFHIWQCRTRRISIARHLVRNTMMALAVTYAVVATIFFVYVPGVNRAIGAAPPPAFAWIFPVVVGVLMLVMNEARKLLIRRRPRSKAARFLKW